MTKRRKPETTWRIEADHVGEYGIARPRLVVTFHRTSVRMAKAAMYSVAAEIELASEVLETASGTTTGSTGSWVVQYDGQVTGIGGGALQACIEMELVAGIETERASAVQALRDALKGRKEAR